MPIYELISYLSDLLSDVDENIIQSLIFLIKMELGPDHPLYDELPYYWYVNGSQCDLITEFFKNPTKKDYNSLIDYYPEIVEITDKLIGKSGLNEFIFKNYAPLEVMHLFKYHIFNPAENEEFSGNGEEYFKLFSKCHHKLLNIRFLYEFIPIFSGLLMQIDFLNDSNNIGRCWNMLRSPIRYSWFAFAEALRIQYHDSYYDEILENWNEMFNNPLKKFREELFDLEHNTFHFIDHSLYGSFTEREKWILDNTIGVCLKDD